MKVTALKILPIPGYDKKYYIDTDGNVYTTLKNFRKLKPDMVNGYEYVNLYKNGRKHKRVHRLVAETFLGKHEGLIVHHIDGNKSNNKLKNLAWITISENTKLAYADGFAKNDKGYDDSQSIPIIAINLKTGEVLKFGSIRIASKVLGVSISTIGRQIHNITKPDYRSKYKFIKQ